MSHPSDLAPALIALGARVGIAGPGGTARGAGRGLLPRAAQRERDGARARRDRSRGSTCRRRPRGREACSSSTGSEIRWDFALSEVAVSASCPRPASGGTCGSRSAAWRRFRTARRRRSRRCPGAPRTPRRIAAAADAAVPRARPLAMNGYKVDLTRALVAARAHRARGLSRMSRQILRRTLRAAAALAPRDRGGVRAAPPLGRSHVHPAGARGDARAARGVPRTSTASTSRCPSSTRATSAAWCRAISASRSRSRRPRSRGAPAAARHARADAGGDGHRGGHRHPRRRARRAPARHAASTARSWASRCSASRCPRSGSA